MIRKCEKILRRIKSILKDQKEPENQPRLIQLLSKNPKGKVLYSYIHDVVLWNENDYRLHGHSNKWESREIAYIFNRLGYSVDAIDWKDEKFVPNDDYDIIFDINEGLQRLACFYPHAKKFLHMTESSPEFSINAEIERLDNLEFRTGKICAVRRSKTIPMIFNRSLRIADYVSLIGNINTLDTYSNDYKYKIKLIPVTASFLARVKNQDEYLANDREFLWFFGSGAVHKGLDIVLEVFKKHTNLKLNIVGNISSEIDFFQVYDELLLHKTSIKFHGFLDPSSDDFWHIVDKCFCFIAPSCSEGSSTAVATCLQIGLFPIISKETGIDIPVNIVQYLDDCRIETLENAVLQAYSMEESTLIEIIMECQKLANKYSRENFSSQMTAFINSSLLAS